MAQAGWCPVRRGCVSTAAALRAFDWTKLDITLHRAGPVFGCTRHYRALPCWSSRTRSLTSHSTEISSRSSQRWLAWSPTHAFQTLRRFHLGFTPLIYKTYSSMPSTSQAAHAHVQQQSQGALVWIDCEVLTASPLLTAFLIASVSPRSHIQCSSR